MADLNSSLYDFVFFLGCFFFVVWLIRTAWNVKELSILSTATAAHSLALLHDLLALSPRITHELLLSHLRKRSTVSEHTVPQLVLPITLVRATAAGAVKSAATDVESVRLIVCARLEGRVECYVGVSRRLLSTLYHNYDAFIDRQRPSDKLGKDRAPAAAASSQHKQQIAPTRQSTAKQNQQQQQQPASFLYSGESEWSSTQHVPVDIASTHTFHVPAAIMQRVRADASLIPMVVVVSAHRTQALSSSSAGTRAAGETVGVEMAIVASSKREQRKQQWLASISHSSPDSTLSQLTILTAAPPILTITLTIHILRLLIPHSRLATGHTAQHSSSSSCGGGGPSVAYERRVWVGSG